MGRKPLGREQVGLTLPIGLKEHLDACVVGRNGLPDNRGELVEQLLLDLCEEMGVPWLESQRYTGRLLTPTR